LKAFVFIERLDDPAGFSAGSHSDESGDFLFPGLSAGKYRTVVLHRGFRAHRAVETVSGDCRVEYGLSEGREASPSRTYSFGERKNLIVVLTIKRFTLVDVAWWLSEMADARITVDSEISDSIHGKAKSITVDLREISLDGCVGILKRIAAVDFDEKTGVFRKRKPN
jgi:hypothetical protein